MTDVRSVRRVRSQAAGNSQFIVRHGIALGIALMLSGCSAISTRDTPVAVAPAPESVPAPARPASRRSGGYYLDDGPGDNPPPNLEQVPDAVPKPEPLHRGTIRPYTIMGQNYLPMTTLKPYKARGIASWYGRRYHGRQTSSGEIYDMYGMTAAHTVLPIPSYARVTNPANNRSIVVRINDRGPFHSERLIDLSYTAAYKLGVLGGGSAFVEVETIIPDAGTTIVPGVAAYPRPVPAAAAVITGVPAAAPPPVAAAPIPLLPVEAGPAPDEAAPVAAPAPAQAAMRPVVPLTVGFQGVFLQLGAFGSQDNAGAYLARLRSQMEWLAPALHVYSKEGLFRVHAGPYANQVEARAAADRISQALGLKLMVLTR